jgi:hypothetical protein
LLVGFFWVIEFVVALNLETQPHCSPGDPHETGPLHCPEVASCLQSAVPAPEHLHTPPGQGRSAKADVTTKENNNITAVNIRIWRIKKRSFEMASAAQAIMGGCGIASGPSVDRFTPAV